MVEALLVSDGEPEGEVEALEVSLLVPVEEALLVPDSESEGEVETLEDWLALCD